MAENVPDLFVHTYKYRSIHLKARVSFRAETTFRRKTDALTNFDDVEERRSAKFNVLNYFCRLRPFPR
jgi:hypothetical protein